MNQDQEKHSSNSSFPPASRTKGWLVHGARLILGLLFVVSGADGFLHWFPVTSMPASAEALTQALVGSGYLMTMVYATELAAGALLLANRYVPLALTLLAPIVVNIVAFHVFLAPHELAVALVVLALEIFLARAYVRAFRPMLAARFSHEGTLVPLSREPLSR